MAGAPVLAWPVRLVAGGGRTAGLAEALGEGGDRVEAVLAAVVARPADVDPARRAVLAAATPAGPVDLPVEVVPLALAPAASAGVDRGWLAAVDRRRDEARALLVGRGRAGHLEAAAHAAALLGTEHLAPGGGGEAGQAASGALLWLLGGVVAWALAAPGSSPFDAWGELVVRGWWPLGPTGGRLAVARLDPAVRG